MRWASTVAPRKGEMRGAVHRSRQRSKSCGCITAHSKAWNPPLDAPIKRSILLIPRCLRTASKASTVSRMVTSGKSSSQGRPVAGFSRAGPSDPYALPSMFTHTTRLFSVSMVLPGPTISGHQSSGSLLAVRAWQIQMTFPVPWEVWKTMCACSSTAPHSKFRLTVISCRIMLLRLSGLVQGLR